MGLETPEWNSKMRLITKKGRMFSQYAADCDLGGIKVDILNN